MFKKVYVKQGFSYRGERYRKNTIGIIEASAVEKLTGEGFIEEVSTALGLDISCDVDLSDYLKRSEIGSLKGEKGDRGEKGEQGIQGIQGERGETGATGANGKDGKDGFPSQEQWEQLVREKETLESTVAELTRRIEALESPVPVSLSAKTTKTKAKKA